MSTNLNCLFLETEPNTWYYLLERMDAPKNAWDWRQQADLYGPFSTQKNARNHLSDHHANPGGSNTVRYEEGSAPDPVIQAHLDAKRLGLPEPRFSGQGWLIETEKGVWYALIEDIKSPDTSYNWLNRTNAYGPFRSAGIPETVMRGAGAISPSNGAYRADIYPNTVLADSPQVAALIATAFPLPAASQRALAEAAQRQLQVRRRYGTPGIAW